MSLKLSTEKVMPPDANINALEVIVKCEPMEIIPPEEIKTEVIDDLYKKHEIKEEIGPVLQGGSVESSSGDNKMTNPPDCGFVAVKQEPEDVIVKSEKEGAVPFVEIEVPALYEDHEVKKVTGRVALQKDSPVQYNPDIDTSKTRIRNFHDVTTPSSHTHNTESDRFICDYCKKEYKVKAVLANHIRVHTGEYKFQCSICGEKFNYGRSLNIHLQTHDGANPHACDLCPKTFPLLCDLKAHQWTHKNIKDKDVVCEICQKQLKRVSLAEHYKIHTGEKPFKCNICDKRFSTKANSERHQVIHTGVKPFPCDLCDERFFSKNCLQYHNAKHTGVKAFSCNICDKRFYMKNDLTTHQKIHTGVKPFSCDICDKRFCRKSVMKRHQAIHTGDKPFPCDVCDKRFYKKFDLQRHLVVHSNDQVQTGVKPFQCEICDKRFCRNDDLKRHQTMHTGVKMFPCDICDKRFFDKKGLKRHMGVHSND